MPPFSLALCFQDDAEVEDDFHLDIFEDERSIMDNLLADLGNILQPYINQQMPYRDIQDILLNNLGVFHIAIFQFGQKQDFSSFISSFDGIHSQYELEIALGLDLTMQDQILLCSNQFKIPGKLFYSLLTSPTAGSVMIKDRKSSLQIHNQSYRWCFYNTTHHSRKHCPQDLRLKADMFDIKENTENEECIEKNSKSVLDEIISLIGIKVLQLKQELVPQWNQNRLRVEGYFIVQGDRSNLFLKEGLSSILQKLLADMESIIISRVPILRCPISEGKELFSVLSDTVQHYAENYDPNSNITNAFVILSLFLQTLRAYYGNERLSMRELKSIPGF